MWGPFHLILYYIWMNMTTCNCLLICIILLQCHDNSVLYYNSSTNTILVAKEFEPPALAYADISFVIEAAQILNFVSLSLWIHMATY